jgi:benzoate-CoA ligase
MRTGDMYARSDDGYYTYLGRSDDMLRVGGEWVSPAEVEAVLVSHGSVLEAAVVAERDDRDVQRPVAFVVAVPDAALDVAELEALCKSELAGYKRPRRYEVVGDLPKTATGKIQRFKLRAE